MLWQVLYAKDTPVGHQQVKKILIRHLKRRTVYKHRRHLFISRVGRKGNPAKMNAIDVSFMVVGRKFYPIFRGRQGLHCRHLFFANGFNDISSHFGDFIFVDQFHRDMNYGGRLIPSLEISSRNPHPKDDFTA